PGHFSQAGRRETIGALTEWISRPIVDITRSQQFLDLVFRDFEDAPKSTACFGNDRVRMFLTEFCGARTSCPAGQNRSSFIGPPGRQPFLFGMDEAKVRHRPKPGM